MIFIFLIYTNKRVLFLSVLELLTSSLFTVWLTEFRTFLFFWVITSFWSLVLIFRGVTLVYLHILNKQYRKESAQFYKQLFFLNLLQNEISLTHRWIFLWGVFLFKSFLFFFTLQWNNKWTITLAPALKNSISAQNIFCHTLTCFLRLFFSLLPFRRCSSSISSFAILSASYKNKH